MSQTGRRSRARALHGDTTAVRDLVERAQQGDLDAFSTLTVGRTARLYQAARLILRDATLAEDVVQDSLVQAWQDLRGLRDPDKFDAWLHRLLIRACYRAADRARRRARVEEIGRAHG